MSLIDFLFDLPIKVIELPATILGDMLDVDTEGTKALIKDSVEKLND